MTDKFQRPKPSIKKQTPPNRKISNFTSRVESGIIVEMEVQFGQDQKSQRLVDAFIRKYMQKKQPEKAK